MSGLRKDRQGREIWGMRGGARGPSEFQGLEERTGQDAFPALGWGR